MITKFWANLCLLAGLLLVPVGHLFSQYTIQGKLLDSQSRLSIDRAMIGIDALDKFTYSDEKGNFELTDVPSGSHRVWFKLVSYVALSMEIEVKGSSLQLGTVELVAQEEQTQLENREDFIPLITLSDEDLEQESENQNISGILSASRDVFISAAAFNFGPLRFRIRGLDSENIDLFMNNAPVNDLENGRVFWNGWGGLNDVMRNRDSDIGLGAIPYSFGGLGGGTTIDTRASAQRKQIRLSASLSNRSYRNRLMGTWSSGLLPSGWAFSLSGSRRWADEGFIEGTFFDSWSYFLSIDRKIGQKHQLNFTGFGSPTKRGRSGASTQEMYDLARTNFYNPHWGFQNGKKRNSRVGYQHQPFLILRHDWKISETSNLTSSVSYQFGQNGSTAIDWFDAPDPRPDFYRNMPSFFLGRGEEQAASIRQEVLTGDPANRQLDWQRMYEVNRNSVLDEKYVYLLNGADVSGNWSQYILEDRRFDKQQFAFNSNYQNTFNDRLTLYAGASFQKQQVDNYKVVEDLLGGDYYVNVDKFAVRDSVGNIDAQQNDLENPGQVLTEGDRFGYDYESHIQKSRLWTQAVYSLKQIDAFIGLDLSSTQFWRVGKFRNGKFPDNSVGSSEKQRFTNLGMKAGVTYKLSGRQYFYANGAYLTRAPYFRNAYVSPRTRDQILPGLTSETIYGGEIGYLLRSPNLKARATVYYNQFEDQARIIRFYNDFSRAFGNYVLSGVDKRHQGLELAVEAKVSAELTFNAVAAIGHYVFSDHSTGSIYLDNTEVVGQNAEPFTVFSKNYRVPGMPQEAYTFGINYNSPKYWFANLNFNYFRNIWIDFNPVRRTTEAVVDLDPTSDQFRTIVDQEETDAAFTLDFFGGKSFKFGKHFIYLNVGVSNILDNRNIRTGGFEQLRFDVRERDVDAYPARYYYGFGRNYFINISYRY